MDEDEAATVRDLKRDQAVVLPMIGEFDGPAVIYSEDTDMGGVVRMLLIAGDLVASWFVAHDALNFPIFSIVAALFLFVCLVALLAFWSAIVQLFRHLIGIDKPK
ncbi:MAG: hypothetical protein ACLQHK_07565 [Gallionellaceae bacterium]